MRQYIDLLQDLNGNAIATGGTVTVRTYPAGTLASIFSDNGLTPILTSIVSTDSTGQFTFFVADGDYTLQLQKNGLTYKTQSPVSIFDGAAQLTYTDSGAANAYAISDSALEKALRTGLRASFKATHTNTTASTFQYNTLAVKNLVLPNGDAPSAGLIVSGGIYRVEYDGTSWQLVSLVQVTTTISVLDFGAKGDGVTNDYAAFAAASAAVGGRGVIYAPKGTYLLGQMFTLPEGQLLIGDGLSQINALTSVSRGATCILRGFTGTNPTIRVTGDDAGIDKLDIDNSRQGTGACLEVWGGRFQGGKFSTRNSGGGNFQIGKSNAGPSDTNTNCWNVDLLCTTGAVLDGLLVDDTNTTTSLSYPLGVSNANSGRIGLLDARGNTRDGMRLGNCNDNCIEVAHAEGNGGCGVRFFTNGTQLGPRSNTIVINDCEGNTGNDIQIDAATLPASAPGGYNRILSNRSVAVNPRIVDNGTCTYILRWDINPGTPGLFHTGPAVNAVNPVALSRAKFSAYAGASYIEAASFQGFEGAGSGGAFAIQTRRNGNTPVDRFNGDEAGNLWTVSGNSLLRSGSASGPKLDQLAGSATFDPPNLADGAGTTTTVTVTGAALGDFAKASFSLDLQGITVTAWVSSANTVSVRFQNESGGALDLASGTLRARVTPQ